MFKYQYEEQLQSYLETNFEHYFGCRLVGKELRVGAGLVDFIGEDDNYIYLIELKRNEVNEHTIKQLTNYLDNFQSDKIVIGIAAAPKISIKEELPHNIITKKIDDVVYNPPRLVFGTAIDKAIHKKFQELAALTRIPQSKLLDEAIEDLLTKYEDKNRG